MSKKVINSTPNVEILNTFESGGHDSFSAIEDIIDNSLEDYVEAHNINIYLETKDKTTSIKEVVIADDGIGMDENTLIEATKLASRTNKKTSMLGRYGVGLKSSAATIGKCLKIITKKRDTPLYSVIVDREEMIKNQSFDLTLNIDDEDDWKTFMTYGNFTSGTVVIISKLHDGKINGQKLLNAVYPKLFVNLGIVFNKILSEKKNLIFRLNNVDIFPINPILSDIKDLKCVQVNEGDETFVYDGKKFTFRVYDVSADTSLNKVLVRQTFENAIRNYYNYEDYQNTPYFDKVLDEIYNYNKLSINNSGLYTYRNNRLTGLGLDMGIIEKGGDGYRNRLRIELFYDGDSDHLFCSSFNKIVPDRKSALNDGFKEKLSDVIKPYRNQVIQDARKRSANEKEKSIDKQKEAERLKNIIEENLNNPMSNLVSRKNGKLDLDFDKERTLFDDIDISKTKRFNIDKDLVKRPKTKYKINVEFQELGEENIICDYVRNGINVKFVLNQSSPYIKEHYMLVSENERFCINEILFGTCSAIRTMSEEYEYPDSVYSAFMKQLTKSYNSLVVK